VASVPYLIDAMDAPGQVARRAEHREVHLAFLTENLPILLAAGAKLDDDGVPIGGAYLVDVDDRASAQAFIDADPYTIIGVFASATITRWRKGFFNYERLVVP
jgi:uncharacterized protein YciI